MNVPGEHLLGVMSANEFLTRVNLMRALDDEYETPLPETQGQGGVRHRRRQHRDGRGAHRQAPRRQRHHRLPPHQERDAGARRGTASRAGGGHQARGAARAARIHRRRQDPFRHPRACSTSTSSAPPDKSGRRSPVPTGETERVPVDLVIMALGNTANPIMRGRRAGPEDHQVGHHRGRSRVRSRPRSRTSISGGDAARGGSTAIRAAGDGQAAAREIVGEIPFTAAEISDRVATRGALHRTRPGRARPSSTRSSWPAASSSSPCARRWWRARRKAGQFVRVLPWDEGRTDPAHARRLGCRGGHHRPGGAGHGHQLAARSTGWRSAMRSPASPARSAAPSELHQYASDADRGVHAPAASACRRSIRSCASTCGWAIT